MPAVHTYWQLPQDEQDFLNFLQSTGAILAFPDKWVKSKDELIPRPVTEYIRERDPQQLRFGPERFALDVDIEKHVKDGETYFALSYMKPCLISYSRGRLKGGNELAQSNLAADWEYLDAQRNLMVAKDPEFLTWARGVFRWIRKSCPAGLVVNGFPYPATTRVRDLVEKGELKVVLY